MANDPPTIECIFGESKQNGSTECSICPAGTVRRLDICVPGCEADEIVYLNTCIKCPLNTSPINRDTCSSTCIGNLKTISGKDVCLPICSSEEYIENHLCVTSCSPGSLVDETNKYCQFVYCSNSEYKQGNICQSSCEDGYVPDINRICKLCTKMVNTFENDCLTKCIKNYFESPTNIYKPCHESCKTCSNGLNDACETCDLTNSEYRYFKEN